MTSTQRLTGRILVDVPPGEAFGLFTPRGEQNWAHGGAPNSRPRPPTTPSQAPSSKPTPTAGTPSGL